jgi:hypothetical protein
MQLRLAATFPRQLEATGWPWPQFSQGNRAPTFPIRIDNRTFRNCDFDLVAKRGRKSQRTPHPYACRGTRRSAATAPGSITSAELFPPAFAHKTIFLLPDSLSPPPTFSVSCQKALSPARNDSWRRRIISVAGGAGARWKRSFGHKFRLGRGMPSGAVFLRFFLAPAVRNVHHVLIAGRAEALRLEDD